MGRDRSHRMYNLPFRHDLCRSVAMLVAEAESDCLLEVAEFIQVEDDDEDDVYT